MDCLSKLSLIIVHSSPQQSCKDFMKGNHIKHILSTLYHPSTNGLPERFIQTFRKAMRASENSDKPLSYRLVNFLLSYWSTPHAMTNWTPSSLFLKRELWTRMDLLRPDTTVRVGERQLSQKCDHDHRAKEREHLVGDNVMARNYGNGPKWMSSVVIEWRGPLPYTVQLESGLLWWRHIRRSVERGCKWFFREWCGGTHRWTKLTNIHRRVEHGEPNCTRDSHHYHWYHWFETSRKCNCWWTKSNWKSISS